MGCARAFSFNRYAARSTPTDRRRPARGSPRSISRGAGRDRASAPRRAHRRGGSYRKPRARLAHAAHGVAVAGDEEHGRRHVHVPQVGGLLDERHAVKQLEEQPRARHAAAERIGDVGVHVFLAHAQPVVARAVRREGLVVGAEGESFSTTSLAFSRPTFLCQYACERLAADEHRVGILPRAHQDRALDRAGIADEVGAREERAHGVTHDKVRQLRIGFAGPAAERVHIVHDVLPASLFAEVEPRRALGDRLAVAEGGRSPRPGSRARSESARTARSAARTPPRRARSAKYRPAPLCGVPFDRVDGRPSVGGGKVNSFSILHSARLLCMV